MTVNLLIAYAHRDTSSMHEILHYLSVLQQQGILKIILKDEITSEEEEPDEDTLRDAHIILLLVSPDFLNSDYCYSPVMKKVIAQHEQRRKVWVVPVILRPVYWQGAPFSRLPVVPHNAKPITLWHNRDEAFSELIRFIRSAIDIISDKQTSKKGSLLIVDSDYILAERLLSIFENDGYSVLNTTNAVQAITLWQEQEPDIALLSTSLYGDDSLTLLQAMRKRNAGAICAISDSGTLQEKVRWFNAGVNDFIVKPIDIQHLFTRVRLLSRISKSSQEQKKEDIEVKQEGEELLTVREVAKLLHVDDTTIRQWIKNGILEAITLPHQGARQAYRIRRSTLEALLEQDKQMQSSIWKIP